MAKKLAGAKQLTEKVKRVGLERRVDGVGRFMLPYDYRKQWGIEPGDWLTAYQVNIGILVCKKDIEIDKYLK